MKDESVHKERYIRYAAELILAYKGDEPFHLYLKKYFKSHKKHGSRDRKNITSLCYHYFRLGEGIVNPMSIEEKFLLAEYLNSENEKELSEKLLTEKSGFDAEHIFPFNEYLSNQIDKKLFNISFLRQPLLFIRIRPGYRELVISRLTKDKINFEEHGESCLSFENTTRLENTLKPDREMVIQDLNSQRSSLFFDKIKWDSSNKIDIWDCCAGSGGKSILAADHFKNFRLTVSDKRKSILQNLQKRLMTASVEVFKIIQADLSKPVNAVTRESFDLIIADVPCSGSGTWGRTPEQLHYFDKDEIEMYAKLQRDIVSNALPKLKHGGYLLYLTCSVFAAENEENTKAISKENGLKIIHEQYLEGYTRRADTLFGSLMKLDATA